ncbi:MAG: DUF3268 family zinc-finger domain-containing protein [Bacteroidaceae bacterium]|nr:DUF3268 family zinc-finger domain-containing protein [Bacteroidaceae bacterium]
MGSKKHLYPHTLLTTAGQEEYDRFIAISRGRLCPYCLCETELIEDKVVHEDSPDKFRYYYRCKRNPDHHVGCHYGTKIPLGRISDSKLRRLKNQCHKAFDPLWKQKPKAFSSRQRAYYWLAKQLGWDNDFTHIGMFGEEQCLRALEIVERFRQYHSTK